MVSRSGTLAADPAALRQRPHPETAAAMAPGPAPNAAVHRRQQARANAARKLTADEPALRTDQTGSRTDGD